MTVWNGFNLKDKNKDIRFFMNRNMPGYHAVRQANPWE